MLCSDTTGTLTQDVIHPGAVHEESANNEEGIAEVTCAVRVALHARVYEVDRGQDRRQSGRFGDTFRLGRCEPGSGLATTHWWGCCTVGTHRRYHGLWEGMCLADGCRSVPLGTLCDTMRWVRRLFVGKIGLGCRLSGRFGDTIRLGWGVLDGRLALAHRLGLLHSWDAPAIPWSVGWLTSCTRVQVGSPRVTLRYHAVGVRGRSWSISVWVAGGRDASVIPSVWVAVYPEVGLDTSRW